MVWIRRIITGFAALILLLWVGMAIYAYWPQEPGVPAAELAGPEDRFIEADGMQLRYRTWGKPVPGQSPIVLIHGFANSVQTWRDLGPALADDYYVIALDMPGFGLSDKPDDRDYSNASQGAAVVAFIEALNLDSAIVGGHSMGGALALHVAEQSDKVTGMIMFNPGIITTGVPAITEYQTFPMHRLSARTFADRNFRANFLRASYLRPEIITEDVIDDVMLGTKTDDYWTGTTRMMQFYEAGNEVEMLADLRIPTLIVWGTEDKNKPDGEAEKLNELFPVSRLALIPDAAHYVQEEKPLESAAAIIDAKDFWAAAR
ncbi:MAG: alpha/beta hydrolase [Gammaproteobacteria bacterium]|nr:alpha/beta hydrolase [Gammaproteobacteria bacterium]NND53945.1 alpha/beta hydrolase [Gammaproteobacteria bacterium]